jgi:hypothetical protein
VQCSDSLAQPTYSEHPSRLQSYMDGRPGFVPLPPGKTDEYVAVNAPYTVKKHKDALVYCLRNITKSTDPTDAVDFSQLASGDMEMSILTRGVATGEDVFGVISKLFGQWTVVAPSFPRVPQLIRIEGQLFRALIQESGSMFRFWILTLWCAICAVLGLQKSVRRVMAAAHAVGKHMASVRCEPGLSLEALYKRQRRHHDTLNTLWDVVMEVVFETRRKLGSLKTDLNVCMVHPAYSCGEKSPADGNVQWPSGFDVKKYSRTSLAPGRFERGQKQDACQFAYVVRNERALGLDALAKHLVMKKTLTKFKSTTLNSPVDSEVEVIEIDA